ncbi:MAG: DUF3037 domain-containing protein [Kineosporiaceae bacterium]
MSGSAGPASGAAGGASERHPYLYALIRLVPSLERGETLNVGVLLYCQNRDYLAAAVHVDAARLATLAPGADLRQACAAVDTLADVAAGRGTSPVAEQPARVRFGWLTSPRSTVVQLGPVHAGLTADPDAALAALLARLVLAPAPQAQAGGAVGEVPAGGVG